MDAVGLALSLIDLCGKLYTYARSVKDGPREVAQLADELRALQDTLERVRVVLEPAVLTKLQTQIAECLEGLQSLDAKVQPPSHRHKFKQWFTRLEWPLKANETEGYVAAIQRLKGSLSLELLTHQMMLDKEENKRQSMERGRQQAERERQELARLEEEAERGLHQLERKDEELRRRDAKRHSILEWIFPGKYDQRHNEIHDNRDEGTGQWIFRTPQFRRWLEPGGQEDGSVLLGCGIAGAGKTYLCSVVIDHLLGQRETDGVAYFYFGYGEQAQQRPVDVLSIFTKQLLRRLPNIPTDIEDAYDEFRFESPNLAMVKRFISLMPEHFAAQGGRVFVVCDALDEADELGQRQDLLPIIHELENTNFRIFLTSRPRPADVFSSFSAAIQLDLVPDQNDLRAYIRRKLDMSRITIGLIENSKTLDQEDVISRLLSSADGMFLLAHLNVTHICQQRTVRDIELALEGIGRPFQHSGDQLKQVYARAIETILRGPKRSAELALRILSWLINARRPLGLEELRTAVAVEKEQLSINPEGLLDVGMLTGICAGLVVIETSQRARLAHYTIQEFLESNDVLPEQLGNGYHAVICATYLAIDEFKTGACGSADALQKRIHSNPFLLYAASYLESHVVSSDRNSTLDAVLRFIQHQSCIESYMQILHYVRTGDTIFWDAYPRGYRAIHVASRIGHGPAVRAIIDAHAPGREQFRRTIATSDLGKRAVAVTSDDLTTPLHVAAEHGRPVVMRLLIEKNASIEAADKDGATPLSVAARAGRLSAVRELVKAGANAAAVDNDGRTPLHLAAKGNYFAVALFLVEVSAGIDAADRKGKSPLYIVLQGRKHELAQESAQRPVEMRTDAPPGSENESAPLHAGNNGRRGPGVKEVVRSLLGKRSNVSRRDRCGKTPLHVAAKNGRPEAVKLLVECGADVSSKDNSGKAPLHYAAEAGRPAVVKILVGMGADVSSKDNCEKTPLHYATEAGRPVVVGILVAAGADVSSKDSSGGTCLHGAAVSGVPEMIQLLVESGAEVTAKDNWQKIPLHYAAQWGKPEAVKLMVAIGADISAKDDCERTPLHYAAQWGRPKVVRILVEKGAEVSLKDMHGETPLHSAVKEGRLEVVKHLVEMGANVLAINDDGKTPLDVAIECGWDAVVGVLE